MQFGQDFFDFLLAVGVGDGLAGALSAGCFGSAGIGAGGCGSGVGCSADRANAVAGAHGFSLRGDGWMDGADGSVLHVILIP